MGTDDTGAGSGFTVQTLGSGVSGIREGRVDRWWWVGCHETLGTNRSCDREVRGLPPCNQILHVDRFRDSRSSRGLIVKGRGKGWTEGIGTFWDNGRKRNTGKRNTSVPTSRPSPGICVPPRFSEFFPDRTVMSNYNSRNLRILPVGTEGEDWWVVVRKFPGVYRVFVRSGKNEPNLQT